MRVIAWLLVGNGTHSGPEEDGREHVFWDQRLRYRISDTLARRFGRRPTKR